MNERRSPTLPERAAAAESAIARFSGQPFAWGERDCLRMVAHALRELGHAPPLRAAGKYATLIGAHRALKRTGHATLQEWVDAWGLRRITPAMALPADILALPSEVEAMPALGPGPVRRACAGLRSRVRLRGGGHPAAHHPPARGLERLRRAVPDPGGHSGRLRRRDRRVRRPPTSSYRWRWARSGSAVRAWPRPRRSPSPPPPRSSRRRPWRASQPCSRRIRP